MKHHCFGLACAILLLLMPVKLSAEVLDSAASGFTSRTRLEIAHQPDKVFNILVGAVGQWWNMAHTFSGDSTNLTIEARPGGCFCERLPDGGGVQHLQVVYVEPGRSLRMTGALGPLQQFGVAGSFTITLKLSQAGWTELEAVYRVCGYIPGGLGEWAGPVDEVLSDQMQRLKRYVETGSAD